jgi:hypothetical protein
MIRPCLTPRRRGGAFTGFIAFLALLIALAALFLAVFRDPFGPVSKMNWDPAGGGLAQYDFSTPAAAYKSDLQMRYNADFRAMLEVSRRLQQKELKEQLDTLDIKKEVDVKVPQPEPSDFPLPILDGKDDKAQAPRDGKFRDVKLLFLTYKKDGETQHKVEAMERHADAGLWKSTYVSRHQVEQVNKDLANEIRDWEAKDRRK